MTQEIPDLLMPVEVVGCPTVCLHCWAVGRPYRAMPLEEISWVLHEVRRFCTAHQLTFSGYPMHEVLAHPQAAQVLLLFQQLWDVAFDPLPTTGVPLATRPDWRETLEVLRTYEVPMLHFAFHGTSQIHDRMVQRKGAYQESLRAVQLAREAQIHTGCNLFVTTENVSHFDQLVADLLRAGMESIAPVVYNFTPNARGRLTEPLRPAWQEVQPILPRLDALPVDDFIRRYWRDVLHTAVPIFCKSSHHECDAPAYRCSEHKQLIVWGRRAEEGVEIHHDLGGYTPRRTRHGRQTARHHRSE